MRVVGFAKARLPLVAPEARYRSRCRVRRQRSDRQRTSPEGSDPIRPFTSGAVEGDDVESAPFLVNGNQPLVVPKRPPTRIDLEPGHPPEWTLLQMREHPFD